MENAPSLSNDSLSESKRLNWELLVEEWKSSGLTQKQFCDQKQVDYCQFRYQRTRFGDKRKSSLPNWLNVQPGEKKSLPISPAAPTQPLPGYFVLKTPQGSQLSIPAGADANTLKILLNFIGENPC